LRSIIDAFSPVWESCSLNFRIAESGSDPEKAAGGWFGDWRGNRTIFGREGLATNGALQEEVVGLLAM